MSAPSGHAERRGVFAGHSGRCAPGLHRLFRFSCLYPSYSCYNTSFYNGRPMAMATFPPVRIHDAAELAFLKSENGLCRKPCRCKRRRGFCVMGKQRPARFRSGGCAACQEAGTSFFCLPGSPSRLSDGQACPFLISHPPVIQRHAARG